MSAVWWLCVVGVGYAGNTWGRAMAHPVPVAVGAGCVLAVGAWLVLLLRWTRQDEQAADTPAMPVREGPVTLPYAEHTVPFDPEWLVWLSRYAEHQEKIGRPVALPFSPASPAGDGALAFQGLREGLRPGHEAAGEPASPLPPPGTSPAAHLSPASPPAGPRPGDEAAAGGVPPASPPLPPETLRDAQASYYTPLRGA